MRTVVGLAVVLVLVAGCGTTQEMAVKVDNPAICGFLGDPTCAELTKGEKGQPGLRWVNPKAQLTQYNKAIVNVVGFFGADASKVSPKDEEMLTALFQKSLTEALSKRYQIVEEDGPGVMRIQMAILDAEAATPGMRSISMVIPQARLLSTATYAIRGRYPFVGGGEAAAKITDSVSGEVLAAAVDRRVGGGSITTAGQWEWGDAENAIKQWSELAADRLYAYTSGTAKP